MATRNRADNWVALGEAYQTALEEGRLETYRKRRWQRSEEFSTWLTEAALAALSEKQASDLYRSSAANQWREFKTNAIEEVRDSLDFLLYDETKLEGRFEECAAEDGGFKLAGAGKQFVSYLMCLRDPGLFAVWSTHAERLLRTLGMYHPGLRGRNLGMGYMDLLEALQVVRARTGLRDFRMVDEFAYAVTRPENRRAE